MSRVTPNAITKALIAWTGVGTDNMCDVDRMRRTLEAAIPHLAPVSVTNDPRVVELASLLRELLPYVATATLEHCDGNKCREPWCIGCSGEDAAIEAATKAQDASVRAYAALANLEKKE